MEEILKTLVFIFLANLIFIYLIIKPPIDKKAKLSIDKQIIVVRLLFLSGILMILYGFSPFFTDVFNYFKYGRPYLKKDTCIVERTFHLPFFFFAKKDIACMKKEHLFKRFITFDNYFKNEKFIFYYLPKSKIVIEQKLIYSPNEKRMRNR